MDLDSIGFRKPNGKVILLAGIPLLSLLLIFMLFNSLFSTVDSGTYHVKQAAITGTMTAKMEPGMYGLYFGSNETWPKAETYYFTSERDTKDDVDEDLSIEVRFNDGSLANISGTIRIILPVSDQQAIDLTTKYGYRKYEALKDKMILPVLRNALRNTANLMSSRESYSTHRSNYVNWAWDQIQNGVYDTEEEEREIVDPISGDKIKRTFKIVKRNSNGDPIRAKDPLEGTGIRLANFEVKQFRYSSAVAKQIETQQKAFMAVATASAKAKQAEQEKIRVMAEGKMEVEKARYEKEQEKIRAVTDAQKEKEVGELKAQKEKNIAEIAANQRKNVAKLDKDAAAYKKQEQILLGEGEAKRKKLVMIADGALKQKLDAWVKAQDMWAKAYSSRKVPAYVVSGQGKSGSQDLQSQQFMNMINVMTAKQLGLDLTIKK